MGPMFPIATGKTIPLPKQYLSSLYYKYSALSTPVSKQQTEQWAQLTQPAAAEQTYTTRYWTYNCNRQACRDALYHVD